jgi:glycosyltransferase involved in cell wall biosynthesis
VRIAFYAPLKPPDHPHPSGDRRVARLLVEALRRGGHEVTLASRLRAGDAGDPTRQRRLEALGLHLAERYLARIGERRPELWLTYHLYDKAPDWIGPRVVDALGIPYVVCEASVAARRAAGPWARGYTAVLAALRRADAVINLNSADVEGVRAVTARCHALKPFLDPTPYRDTSRLRSPARERFGALGIDPAQPWLVAVGMMRPGDKLASYRLLAAALAKARPSPWQLLVAGDGRARPEVEAALAVVAPRVRYLGALGSAAMVELLAAGDLFVWPAINEAFGMAPLEAQAAGLPVLAGRTGGVPDIVADGVTGLLTPIGDADAFAAALRALIDDPGRRRAMGEAARQKVAAEHDIAAAASWLNGLLTTLRRPQAAA